MFDMFSNSSVLWATVLMFVVALGMLAAVLFFIWSVYAQRRYNRDTLPRIEGTSFSPETNDEEVVISTAAVSKEDSAFFLEDFDDDGFDTVVDEDELFLTNHGASAPPKRRRKLSFPSIPSRQPKASYDESIPAGYLVTDEDANGPENGSQELTEGTDGETGRTGSRVVTPAEDFAPNPMLDND